jgi:hypothetical protein
MVAPCKLYFLRVFADALLTGRGGVLVSARGSRIRCIQHFQPSRKLSSCSGRFRPIFFAFAFMLQRFHGMMQWHIVSGETADSQLVQQEYDALFPPYKHNARL